MFVPKTARRQFSVLRFTNPRRTLGAHVPLSTQWAASLSIVFPVSIGKPYYFSKATFPTVMASGEFLIPVGNWNSSG